MYTREYTRLQKKIQRELPYKMQYWTEFDFSKLSDIIPVKKRGGHKNVTYNDIIIMFDTETSKKPLNKEDNHVVAWSICFRAFHVNIATLYGADPWELCDMFKELRKNLAGHDIYIYAHNLAYDWIFVRKFLIERFGEPSSQLNTKSYNPLFIKFENGLIFKDSLILASRSLMRWAKDLNVEHQKAMGNWDYSRYRNQSEIFELTEEELLYIENDVRAGVECLDATCQLLKKNISTIPYTSTGIMRDIARNIGKKNHAHEFYEKVAPDVELQKILEIVFHGGYTHANRYCTVSGVNHGIYNATCYDFSSSYPFVCWPTSSRWRNFGFLIGRLMKNTFSKILKIGRLSCTLFSGTYG